MRRWIIAGLLIAVAAGWTADRVWLSASCAPPHSAAAAAIPVFGPATSDGMVTIPAGSFQFRARVGGFTNRHGEGVILLHGFPETSIVWEPVIRKLAGDGYRVVAFDQRGYSPLARPKGISSYAMNALVEDVMAVADSVGFDRFHLVGHDWGGVVSWHAAARHGSRITTLTSLSMPHPAAFREALSHGTDQLMRSSYAALLWLPWLPEFLYGYSCAAYLDRTGWDDKPPRQRAEYRAVYTEPGALEGILNWYRANPIVASNEIGKISQPTLFIWGSRDDALGRVGAEKTGEHVEGPYRMLELPVGHDLMNEAPARVGEALTAHLNSWGPSPKSAPPRDRQAQQLGVRHRRLAR